MAAFFRKIGSFFLDLIETVVIALAVFVIIYLFLFQPHQVRGSSMLPNFHDGEYLLTDKISYRLGEPQRGDVVVFKAPSNQQFDYIKRIVGLPGEKIKIEDGKFLINDQILQEDYLPGGLLTFSGAFLASEESVFLAEDQYFVLGDNRSSSSDSRDWGLVPRANIIGKTWLRYWPPQSLAVFKKEDY